MSAPENPNGHEVAKPDAVIDDESRHGIGGNNPPKPPPREGRWYRAHEVYKGNCPPSTFYLMAERGEIELFKVGRRTYLRENWEQILTRLAQRKEPAVPA